MLEFEQKYWKKGVKFIAGIDEAGRGPLAGPVVAAAVIFPHNIHLPGVKDSKQVSEKKREILFDKIYNSAIAVGIGLAHEDVIDANNILQATYQSMRQSVNCLSVKPEIILVDGRRAEINDYDQESIIDGDKKSLSIAAASIIAKVTRDRIMRQYDIIFPEYGFSRHKGYGTKQHIENIVFCKASPVHRKTFNPIPSHLPSFAFLKRNHRLSKLGVQIAGCHLIRTGHKVIEINYNIENLGRLDIISCINEILVLSEVKLQTNVNNVNSSPAIITTSKKDRIINAVERYTSFHDIDLSYRFDVIEVSLGKGRPDIKISEDILADD